MSGQDFTNAKISSIVGAGSLFVEASVVKEIAVGVTIAVTATLLSHYLKKILKIKK